MRVQELFDLSGRTALVTGGGRGLGRHMAMGLAEAGADVIVASRKLQACEEAAEAIEKLGRRAWAMRCDMGSVEEIDALVERTLATVPRLHILINNAAIAWGEPTLEYSLAGWDKSFAVNVRGPWHLSQQLARHMKDEGGGTIIHVSSISGFRAATEEGMPTIAYNASKGALITLTKDMAVKLAPYGIRVNGIAPGAFLTDMAAGVQSDEHKRKRLLASIPQHRWGGEDDMKAVAVFLASDASAFVSGHTLVVDGGQTAL